MPNAPSRFLRQEGLVPRDALQPLTVTVIGVGAIGRQLALQLAALGVTHLQLCDFDAVEITNVTTQGYAPDDIGLLKVQATARDVRRIEPSLRLTLVPERFRPQLDVGDVVFCCVDSITTRAAIWRSVSRRCRCWFDARMLGEVLRILTASDERGREHYSSTLFDPAEAQPGACTSRGVIYTAAIAAGLLVHQFSRWLRNLPLDRELSLNLLASECDVR
jgi:sulfur carrier protein ThiS adenylyltransferase